MKYFFYALLFAWGTPAFCQTFTQLSIKTGPCISGQKKSPELFNDGGTIYGLSLSIEPTILTFGSKKQFDFNTDLSFIQKGGINYSPVITSSGTGSENYLVTLNYISFSPTVSFNFLEMFFIKAGARIDGLISFKKEDAFSSDPRTRKDFNSTTYGITYGTGIRFGKKNIKYVCELDGQNDFSKSSYNPASGQSFKNYCFILNFGATFPLSKKDN